MLEKYSTNMDVQDFPMDLCCVPLPLYVILIILQITCLQPWHLSMHNAR